MSQTDAFTATYRVYYEDTDAAGVVYHSNYLKYFERARTDWLRADGFNQSALAAEKGIRFVVASMDIRFIRAAKLDDELLVSVSLNRLRRAAMVLDQTLWRLPQPGSDGKKTVLTQAQVVVACVNNRFKPTRLPNWLTEKLKTGQ